MTVNTRVCCIRSFTTNTHRALYKGNLKYQQCSMGMGHNVLYLSGIFITLVVFSSGSDINNAENKIVVENNAKDVEIHCVINRDDLPQSDSESKGLYMCPTMGQCRNESRDRFIIARIENNTIFNYNPKEYKVSMNGTLTVRKMSSKYDGMVVWCILMVPLIGAGENTTVIQIAKERPKLNINSPQLFAVVQGMTLHLDFDATGYPSPRVIWFRDEQVLQNRSIEESTSLVLRNVTKNDEGKYNCTATNLLGSDSYEVQVNVIEFQNSTLPTPIDKQGGRESDPYEVITYVFLSLLILAGGYIFHLRRRDRRRNHGSATLEV